MNITRAKLKETLRTIVNEESEYQSFFKAALEKAGKSIPSMSDEEKKAFFDKIDAAWDGKGEKNEALVGGQKELDIDKDGDIEADDLADLRAGKTVDEAYSGIVGKTVFSDGKGKLFFGYYKEDDSVHFVDYKTWAKLSLKDVSKGDTNKDRVISSILKSQKQFNKKVDYNMWAKKTNPSFEEKMDWFIKNGWISNINKGGIKESINEEKPGLWANIRAKQARGEKPAHGNSDAHKDAVAAGKKINKEESVNEAPDTKKRFMFDFYTDSFQRNTERETNFMATTLESAIKAAEHICKVTGYGYVEIYYKDLFLGSMKKKDGFKFVEGRGYKKFNSTN